MAKVVFPVTSENWKVQSVSDSDGREVSSVVIGCEKKENSEDADSNIIVEEIYSDLLPLVFEGEIKVYTNLKAYPKLVFELNEKIIPHNPAVRDLLVLVDKNLEVSGYSDSKYKVLAEINQINSGKVLNTNFLKMLRLNIEDKLEDTEFKNERLNYKLLMIYLRDKYKKETLPEADSLAYEMYSLKKEELVCLHGEILEFDEKGECKAFPLHRFMSSGRTIEEIKEGYNSELQRRFFLGEVS